MPNIATVVLRFPDGFKFGRIPKKPGTTNCSWLIYRLA